MICPVCGKKLKVTNTTAKNATVYRRRKCDDCNYTLITQEQAAENQEQALKDMTANREARKWERQKKK